MLNPNSALGEVMCVWAGGVPSANSASTITGRGRRMARSIAEGRQGKRETGKGNTALALLNTRELQAAVAHEIGHEYVWPDYERAKRIQELELMCDVRAIGILHHLGVGASEL